MVADRGYSSHALRTAVRELGSRPAIPTRRNETPVHCPDWINVNRERVERMWNRLKQWRAIATRYERTAYAFPRSYTSLPLAIGSNPNGP